MSALVNTLIKSQEQAHVFHLETRSFAQHMALQGYYTKIPDLIDRFVETYHATHKSLGAYKGSGRLLKDPKKIKPYFKALALKVRRFRIPKKEPWLEQIRVEVLELIMNTIYKLGLNGNSSSSKTTRNNQKSNSVYSQSRN